MTVKKDFPVPAILLVFLFSAFTISAQTEKWPGGIHDPSSIVKCDDTYWIFGTGDGIYSMSSKDLITWKETGKNDRPFQVSKYESGSDLIVTSSTCPAWINEYVHGAKDSQGNPVFHGGFWAPDVIYMNGKYYLYYSCSEWGTMTSTIGCVTNKTLNPDDPDYKWEDVGFLGIWSYQPGLALNAIDPSVTRGPDGKIWMVYGSFNQEGIVVCEIDSVSGKPMTYSGNLPGRSIANSWTGPQSYNYGEGEGASMIYRDGYYYLFYNKGGCCAGIASTYYMVMGRAANPRGPFLDKTGNALKVNGQASGGTIVLKHDNSRGQDDRYFGPGHFGLYSENGVDYVTFHYYDPNGFYPNPAVNNQGGPTLGLGKLVWGDDGWPEISLNFLDEGVYTLENAFSGKAADVQTQALNEGNYLYQYTADSSLNTQKWVFKSLGGGEYTLQNYADPGFYVEAGGTDNATLLYVTGDYDAAVNQRFRTLTSPKGRTIVYPSTKDNIMGVWSPTASDARLSLKASSGDDYQQWKAQRFTESLNTSDSRITVDHLAGADSSIVVSSNGLWSINVSYDSWLTVETSGVGNDTLKLIYDENPDASDRRNRIYLSTHGGLQAMITLTQKGRPNAVDRIKSGDALVLYPNPANDFVFMENPVPGILTVFNQTGQKVKELFVEAQNTRLPIGELKSGLYFFQLRSNDGVWVSKLLKN